MKKEEITIATGLDRTHQKKVRETRKLLEKLYSKPGANYYEYMMDRFVDLGGNNSVRYAIADNWHMLKELTEHYKKNKVFARSLDRIAEDGHDFGGIVSAGERLQAMFTFFDGFYHTEFENLIELKRLQRYPEQFSAKELSFLSDYAVEGGDINIYKE